MRKRHQIGESGWSDVNRACVRDQIIGRLIVWLLAVTTNVAASEVYALDEDGRAVQDDLHTQLIKIIIRHD